MNTDDAPLYYVYLDEREYVEGAGYEYLSCGWDREGSGEFGCRTKNGADTFFHCPVTGPPDALVFGTVEGGTDAGHLDCVGVGVWAECV